MTVAMTCMNSTRTETAPKCLKEAKKFGIFDDDKKYVYSFCESCFKQEQKNVEKRKLMEEKRYLKLTEISKEEYGKILRK